ncbi:MAG: sporulation protein [Oscillibacter sp.]|nr:sporulation protein [Oscillibacter sp.]
MEKRGRKVLADFAERFDLPADIVAGLPHLEMVGSREVYVEHHTGLLSYSEERIDANTTAGILRITGSALRLTAMTAEELRIAGRIETVSWMEALT